MYKLMLVTEDAEILAAIGSVKNWEMYGFREPRIVPDHETAIEKLQKHHVDAVAMHLSQVGTAELTAYLNEQAPLLPILYLMDEKHLDDRIIELGRFLSRLSADNSDEWSTPADNLRRMRHAYFRSLISGKVQDAASVTRMLGMLRSRMDPFTPCMLLRFSLPEGDDYLAGRWHYGNERLEIAMRNIVGTELQGMRLLVSVTEDDRIYLLACPMLGEKHGL